MADCSIGAPERLMDDAQLVKFANESSSKGSRYGQYVLGRMYQSGIKGLECSYDKANTLYQQAAAQGLDAAQVSVGWMYNLGLGVDRDFAEALWRYKLAGAQGYPEASVHIAQCYECGLGVPKNKVEAMYWYRRAQAAGHPCAAAAAKKLNARK